VPRSYPALWLAWVVKVSRKWLYHLDNSFIVLKLDGGGAAAPPLLRDGGAEEFRRDSTVGHVPRLGKR